MAVTEKKTQTKQYRNSLECNTPLAFTVHLLDKDKERKPVG